MHTHQSLWKAGKNVFYDAKNYALISDTARYYIGGILQHAHALCAFVAPPPIDENLYDLPPQEAAKVKSMPDSLDEALHALENNTTRSCSRATSSPVTLSRRGSLTNARKKLIRSG